MVAIAGSFEQEEDRIRAAYARRHDGALYSSLNPGHLFMTHGQERAVLDLLRRAGHSTLSGVRILDVGCGTGRWLRNFVQWGARPEQLVGIDLLEDRILQAKNTSPAGVTIRQGSAASLPDPDASFDIVTQFMAFTSILDPQLRRAAAAEMLRVLRPGGLIIWYDYHVPSPHNRDVRAIRKREICALFESCSIRFQRVTLAPPIVRFLSGRATWAATMLEAIPLLRTHYLCAIRKQASRD